MFKKNIGPSISRKGIAIETIGYLVLAVIALVLLWVLLLKLAPHITDMVTAIVNGIRCYICNKILGLGKWVVGFCWGC